MLKHGCLALVLLTLLLGCDQEPQLNYDDDVLVKVLKDMLIAEGAATKVGNDQRDSLNRFYYGQIYDIHQIDSLKFSNDLKNLGEDPAHSIRIYTRVEKELEADQVKAKKGKDKKKK